MGTWRRLQETVALAALLCATRAVAGTVVEPIARLYLEGGYDSNPLYDGGPGDAASRVSPEVGLRLRAPLWDLRTTYGGEYVHYQRLAPGGIWNHRGGLALEATPTERTHAGALLRASQAFDPAALAQAGVFRSGRQEALTVVGRGRLDWRASRRIDSALTFTERTVHFQDGTGGAMHSPTTEALWRFGRLISLGGAYGFGVFQEFRPDAPDEIAFSHALRARARWRPMRHVTLDASAGPTLWVPSGSTSLVPEASLEMYIATRGLDVRTGVTHGLGIGATASPGLVDSLEFGVERRLGRRYVLRSDGGLWRSGTVPDNRFAVTGYAVSGEAGILLQGVRFALAASHFGRLDDSSGTFRRTTVGLRLGWELPLRGVR